MSINLLDSVCGILLSPYCISSGREAAALVMDGDASSITLAQANILVEQAPDEEDVSGRIKR